MKSLCKNANALRMYRCPMCVVYVVWSGYAGIELTSRFEVPVPTIEAFSARSSLATQGKSVQLLLGETARERGESRECERRRERAEGGREEKTTKGERQLRSRDSEAETALILSGGEPTVRVTSNADHSTSLRPLGPDACHHRPRMVDP